MAGKPYISCTLGNARHYREGARTGWEVATVSDHGDDGGDDDGVDGGDDDGVDGGGDDGDDDDAYENGFRILV